jgi:Tfp pilus assembly protein PilF
VGKTPAPEVGHSAVPKITATNTTHLNASPKQDVATNVAKTTGPTNAPKSAAVTNRPSTENVEVVKLGSEPVIKPAEDSSGAAAPVRSPEVRQEPQNSTAPDTKTQKRGFFQRINPINLFKGDAKQPTAPSPLMASTQGKAGGSAKTAAPTPRLAGTTSTASQLEKVEQRNFPRYAYRSPDRPASGDRSSAEAAFSQGVREQQAQQFTQSIQHYRQAAQMDPGYYDAHYNLGLAAAQSGNLPLALASYETALAIEPESLDARYNFGLTLKQAGYFLDAVAEFERILAKYPNDSRTHLALGNLYAQQLQEPEKARPHYLAVLAVAPQSPQAGAIRYWLTDHPK